MQATKTLPANYREHRVIDLSNNPRALLILNLLSIPLLALAGWLLFWLASWLRPALEWRGVFSGGALLAAFLLVVILIAFVLVLHEAIHGLFFFLFTRERPVFALKALYAYAAAPAWYIPRRPYMVVGIAPLVIITLLGILLLPIITEWLVLALLVAVALNAAGAIADIAIVGWLLFQPDDSLICDHGDKMIVYRPVVDAEEAKRQRAKLIVKDDSDS